MINAHMKVYDLRDFTQCHGTLVTEASDIGLLGERLYDDACDVGIAIKSHYTGRVAHFYLHETHKLGEEVSTFEFRPVEKDKDIKYVVSILND